MVVFFASQRITRTESIPRMTNDEQINEFIVNLAKRIARVYQNGYADEEDYIQTGHLKLAEIRRSAHVKRDFFSYAIISIARAMRCAAVDAMCVASAPHKTKTLVHKAAILMSIGSTEQEVCDALNITSDELSDLKLLSHHESWQELFEEPSTCSEQFSFFDDLAEVDSLTDDDIDFLRSQLDGTTDSLGLSRNQVYKKSRSIRPKLARSGYGI